ncbi:MAG: hypothetical protein M1825_005298 [Sarcosagium campestre]|nr:MAG: hypothetical protein M1825_005298 [Sarcosagium campestre]
MSKPEVFEDETLLQLKYELPHLVHTAKTYPLHSPNGSTILVYGHPRGLRIIWNGGRPFKSSNEVAGDAGKQANGAGHDVIMISDSDDDGKAEPDLGSSEDYVDTDFVAEEVRYDDSASYPPVIQQVDLDLGTAVLHISFPTLRSDISASSTMSRPQIANQRIVTAVTCADRSVRIVTLPLFPPSPARKKWAETRTIDRADPEALGPLREQIVVLGGHDCHKEIPNDIAITFSSRYQASNAESDFEDDLPAVSRKRVHDHYHRQQDSKPEWDVLVASHSSDVTGSLLLFRIPVVHSTIQTRKEYLLSGDHAAGFRTEYLQHPALSLRFNPAPYPARRHAQLLLADSSGAVRIYEWVSSRSKPTRSSSTGRRSSFAGSHGIDQGSWLISLYPGFENPRVSTPGEGSASSLTIGRRKNIVDATWVLGGWAIMVLLSDGEWGIWDLAGAGPNERRMGASSAAVAEPLLRGGARTAWSVSGWMTASADDFAKRMGNRAQSSSTFAPRTPHTRRVEERKLFSGSLPPSSHRRGGIATRMLNAGEANLPPDDVVVIWHDESVAFIPSLRAYWNAQVAKLGAGGAANFLDSDLQGQLIRLEGLKTRGDMIGGVDLFPPSPKRDLSAAQATESRLLGRSLPARSLPTSILVTAEHRFLVVSAAPARPGPARQSQPEAKLVTDQRFKPIIDLDPSEIDRALAKMESPAQRDRVGPRKKVGFANSS